MASTELPRLAGKNSRDGFMRFSEQISSCSDYDHIPTCYWCTLRFHRIDRIKNQLINPAFRCVAYPEIGEEVKGVVQPADMSPAGPELEQELIGYCQL